MALRARQFSPAACQPQLSPTDRKRFGVFYTPPEIVRLIAGLVLQPRRIARSAVPRLIDPACGAGEFLLEAYRRLAEARGECAAREAVFGIDIDSSAVNTARSRLQAVDPRFS